MTDQERSSRVWDIARALNEELALAATEGLWVRLRLEPPPPNACVMQNHHTLRVESIARPVYLD